MTAAVQFEKTGSCCYNGLVDHSKHLICYKKTKGLVRSIGNPPGAHRQPVMGGGGSLGCWDQTTSPLVDDL